MKVLVTAVGGDLGQGLVKALRLSTDPIQVLGCDSDTTGVGSAFVDSYHVVPLAKNVAEYVEALDTLCRQLNIDAVIPGCEPEIAVLSRLNLPSETPIVCQKHQWVDQYGDKFRCMQSLSNTVELAPFADGNDRDAVQNVVSKTGFPVVIKARSSSGSRTLRIARNMRELEAFIAQVPSSVVQAYLDDTGGEFSVGMFACDNFTTFISYRRELGPVGCTWFAETSDDAEVLDYARRVANATHLKGSANLQVRKTSRGVRLLEINPRFSSLVAARAACEFRDVEWSIRLTLGLKLTLPVVSYRHIRFRRYFHEMIDFGDGFTAIEDWRPRSQYANKP
jgi:carbamoyl-phosphate synthase large subunit